MKDSWKRLCVATTIVVASVATVRALADQANWADGYAVDRGNLIKKDTTSCKKLQQYCTVTCEDSTYPGIGLCQDGNGTKGPTSAISIQCCCCTEGWEHRSFIGG